MPKGFPQRGEGGISPARRAVFACVARGVWFILPCGHAISPSGEVWTPARRAVFACAAGCSRLRGERFSPAWRGMFRSFCPAGTLFRPPAKFGRLRGARQGGAGYGAAPPARPPLHPPRTTPLEVFNYHSLTRARVLCCGSFLPSLCSLRRSPSATRKCQSTLSLRIRFHFSRIPLIGLITASELCTRSCRKYFNYLINFTKSTK